MGWRPKMLWLGRGIGIWRSMRTDGGRGTRIAERWNERWRTRARVLKSMITIWCLMLDGTRGRYFLCELTNRFSRRAEHKHAHDDEKMIIVCGWGRVVVVFGRPWKPGYRWSYKTASAGLFHCQMLGRILFHLPSVVCGLMFRRDPTHPLNDWLALCNVSRLSTPSRRTCCQMMLPSMH